MELVLLAGLLLLISGCPNELVGLGPGVDVEDPSAGIRDIANGDYVRGEILLSGTAEDDTMVTSVEVLVDGTPLEASLTRGSVTSWECTVDTTAFADGEYDIEILATDSSGRTSRELLMLYFDNTPPTVLVTSGEGITDGGASTNTPLVRGEAYDYPFSRLASVEAVLVAGNAQVGEVEGKNGWSFSLAAEGSGEYTLAIIATDMAGNQNSFLYHLEDFPAGAAIEDIALGDAGAGPLFSGQAEKRKSDQTLSIDLSRDEPEVVVSNPAPASVVGGTSSVVGYVQDDDGVDPESIEISFDGGTTWTAISTSLGGTVSGTALFKRWTYSMEDMGNGAYSLKVRAKDTNKPSGDPVLTGYSPSISFTMDRDAPNVTITSPEQGSFLDTGSFTVTGTASDPGGSITGITIRVNGAEPEAISFTPGEHVSWTYPLSGIPDGTVTLRLEAVDDSLKSTVYSQQLSVDTQAPEVAFLSPNSGEYINGNTILRGTGSDNWVLRTVKVQIGGQYWEPSLAEDLSTNEFYSWERLITSSLYENSTLAQEVDGIGNPSPGSGIWRLKYWAQAEDMAGNTHLQEDYCYIDNSLDRPGVSIASPLDGGVLAGSVNLAGSAWDDRNEAGETLDHVEIRLWKGNGGTPDAWFDLNALMGLTDEGSGWYRIAGTSTWSVELNGNGELYPNGSDHDGTVKVEVRGVDAKGGIPDLAGNAETITITFDDTVPYFASLSHGSGEYVQNEFTLSGTVFDDEGVSRLRISYNGGVDWETLGINLGTEYQFTIPVTVAATGILYIKLEITDDANYKALQSINLNVDTLDPTGSYGGNTSDISGTFRLQGTATDLGVVSGIDRIEATFTQGGAAAGPVITIDSRTEEGNDLSTGGDKDGFNESMSLSGNTWSWWADMDSTVFSDGPVEITYAIYDNAGNSFSETVSGNIRNHAPEITSINIGWDRDMDGTVEVFENESFAAGGALSNSVYGNLEYTFGIDYDGSNGEASYSVRYLFDGTWYPLPVTGDSGTIDTTALSGDGAYTFEFSITDPIGYGETISIDAVVANTDAAPPSLVFEDLDSDDAAYVKANATGHIELTDLFGTGNKVISGQIRFTGTAEDDQQIQSLSCSVADGPPIPIVSWNSVTKVLEAEDGCTILDGSGFVESAGSLVHRVNYEFLWDSASDPSAGGADTGVKIEFIVVDGGGNESRSYRVFDIAPYITSLDTLLATTYSDELARSATGSYPVYRDSSSLVNETITVRGFNLVHDAVDSVRISSDPDGLNETGTPLGVSLPFSDSDGSSTHQALDVEMDTTGSGYLSVLVNGIPSINNINPDSAANQEASQVHQELSDDRYLSVWLRDSLGDANSPLAVNAIYPSMAMSGDIPSFVYVNNAEGYGQGLFYDGTTDTEKQIIDNWDLFTHTALDFTDDGYRGALVDVNVVNGNFGDYNPGNYGGILVNFFYDVPSHNWGNYDFIDNNLWLENLVDTGGTTTAVLNRYQYPDLVLEGNSDDSGGADVHYVVYDKLTDSLIYRHFLVGTDSGVAGDGVYGGGGRLNNAGTALYTNLPQYESDGTFPEYNGDDRFVNSATAGQTPVGAQVIDTGTAPFSAVAAASDGTALLAYYDTAGSGSLIFKYNSSPDNPAGWSSGVTIDTFVNAEYIDMVVDASDVIHLAYFDSFHGDASYVRIPSYSSNATAITQVAVDTYLIVGSKMTISVNSAGNPVISYKGIGNSGRVAWLSDPGTVDHGVVGDSFTGVWEIQTLPASIKDHDANRFCAGVDSTNQPVVGFSDGVIQYMKLLGELDE